MEAVEKGKGKKEAKKDEKKEKPLGKCLQFIELVKANPGIKMSEVKEKMGATYHGTFGKWKKEGKAYSDGGKLFIGTPPKAKGNGKDKKEGKKD